MTALTVSDYFNIITRTPCNQIVDNIYKIVILIERVCICERQKNFLASKVSYCSSWYIKRPVQNGKSFKCSCMHTELQDNFPDRIKPSGN